MAPTRRTSGKTKGLPARKRKDLPPKSERGRTRVGREAKIERRSATRPTIVEGWRKTLERDLQQKPRAHGLRQNARVDIWVTHTDSCFRSQSCLQILTQDDWSSITRLQSPSSRISAVAARVLLRIGLSRAVNRAVAPSDWRFETMEGGKPIVADAFPDVNFSISHLDQIAMVAISPSLNIGIDVEDVDQNVTEALVAGFCHPDEESLLRRLPPARRLREFIRLWTLKEAYTKMIASGHSVDFAAIKFKLDPIDLVASSNSPMSSRTFFENFYVAARHSLYHASVAVEQPLSSFIPTEIQILSLTDPTGTAGAFPAPAV